MFAIGFVLFGHKGLLLIQEPKPFTRSVLQAFFAGLHPTYDWLCVRAANKYSYALPCTLVRLGFLTMSDMLFSDGARLLCDWPLKI